MPQSIHEELDVLTKSGAQFSQETIIGLASFVENAQEEIDKVNQESMLLPQYDYERTPPENEEEMSE